MTGSTYGRFLLRIGALGNGGFSQRVARARGATGRAPWTSRSMRDRRLDRPRRVERRYVQPWAAGQPCPARCQGSTPALAGRQGRAAATVQEISSGVLPWI